MAHEAPDALATPLVQPSSRDTESRPARLPAARGPVLIDCDRCGVRGTGCGDCVVTFLLGGPPSGVVLDDEERRAIDVLADAGLVPPLRMVQPLDSRHDDHCP